MQPVPGGSFARCEHNSHCDQKEASKATRKKKDLENDEVKYFPKLQPAAARSFMLDNEISSELAVMLFFREGMEFLSRTSSVSDWRRSRPGEPHFIL